MILLIDNYDSFVFNLERYLRNLGQTTVVVRSDEVDLAWIAAGHAQAIVISPGPKAPADAGLSLEVVERFHDSVPMLGVCLGHQVICQALGGRIVRAPRAVHGQASAMEHRDSRLLAGLPNPFLAARYHSLVADAATLPTDLRITATTQAPDNRGPLVMAVEHTHHPVFGVQFHPESILSSTGYRILANFLQLAGLPVATELPQADFANQAVWERFVRTQAVPSLAAELHAAAPLAVLPNRVVSATESSPSRPPAPASDLP